MQQSLAVSAAKAVWQPSVKTHSDETLIALIATHDRNAMRDLFVRHKTRVFRFLLRVAGDAAAAEDLLNEVFIEIWRHAGKFEGRSKVSTWMLAIAHFKATAWRRRRASDQLDDDATAMGPHIDRRRGARNRGPAVVRTEVGSDRGSGNRGHGNDGNRPAQHRLLRIIEVFAMRA